MQIQVTRWSCQALQRLGGVFDNSDAVLKGTALHQYMSASVVSHKISTNLLGLRPHAADPWDPIWAHMGPNIAFLGQILVWGKMGMELF